MITNNILSIDNLFVFQDPHNQVEEQLCDILIFRQISYFSKHYSNVKALCVYGSVGLQAI